MNAAILPAAEDAADPDTGKLGMWIFLASEVLFFGGLFVAYLYGRTTWPQGWAAASRHTDVVLGTVNTALLQAAAHIANNIIQSLGVIEQRHLTRDGKVNLWPHLWPHGTGHVATWAEQNNLDVVS